MKAIAMFVAILVMGGWIMLFDDVDKYHDAWDHANNYYQAELYADALPYFTKALEGYKELGYPWMTNITHCCIAYCHLNLGDVEMARRHAYMINSKEKIKDGEWNRSISDLYGRFSDDKMQVLYLKRAKKYGKYDQ